MFLNLGSLWRHGAKHHRYDPNPSILQVPRACVDFLVPSMSSRGLGRRRRCVLAQGAAGRVQSQHLHNQNKCMAIIWHWQQCKNIWGECLTHSWSLFAHLSLGYFWRPLEREQDCKCNSRNIPNPGRVRSKRSVSVWMWQCWWARRSPWFCLPARCSVPGVVKWHQRAAVCRRRQSQQELGRSTLALRLLIIIKFA